MYTNIGRNGDVVGGNTLAANKPAPLVVIIFIIAPLAGGITSCRALIVEFDWYFGNGGDPNENKTIKTLGKTALLDITYNWLRNVDCNAQHSGAQSSVCGLDLLIGDRLDDRLYFT